MLLYNYNGGWQCKECTEIAKQAFYSLAHSKGFDIDTTSLVADLTLENLRRYQVIVWNYNHHGKYSVPDSAARNAVAEYIRQGGGWLLVNLAVEHANDWPFLSGIIGPGSSGWQGSDVSAELVADSAAGNAGGTRPARFCQESYTHCSIPVRRSVKPGYCE